MTCYQQIRQTPALHEGFPVGTLIGVLILIALGRGSRLFGPERMTHKELETEWKYRRKNKVQ